MARIRGLPLVEGHTLFTRRMPILAMLVAFFTLVTPIGHAQAVEIDDETRFVQLINDLRVSDGLEPLRVHNELVGPSRGWAQQLSNNGSLSHAADLSVGVTVYWTKLGENVGVAAQDQVQQLFDAFVTSPTHYENLIDPSFRFIGVGVVYDDEGRMWTAHRFMALGQETTTTSGPPPPTTTPTTTVSTAPPTTAPPVNQPTTTTGPPPEQLAFQDAASLDPEAVVSMLIAVRDSGI
jgi:uncharacterized protein YkwD